MNEPTQPSTATDKLAQAAAIGNRIKAEINKAFIGQSQVVEQILLALFAGGHVLIEGVPGLGKTLLVRALAKTFDGSFTRIQFTPDLMPSDVTGHAMYDLKSDQFRIRKGPVFTNLLLADEINRAPAKTQAALLECMQEAQVTIEGQALTLPTPFMTLATQNPIEQEGTYPLPEAQLDRFLLKVLISYPNEAEEKAMLTAVTSGQVGDTLNVSAVNTLIKPATITTLQQIVSTLIVDERVSEYAVRITRKTREWPGIAMGAGPRGGLALVRTARAKALLAGRDFVTPDDIKNVALPALRHRVSLAPELEIEGHHPDDILTALLEKIEAPRK
ncbi:MAG: MoxR family ATPase [Gammaproteobacteria bacterium]|nr:MoxR family ATPase [Gammaproteobacteria bacterium]